MAKKIIWRAPALHDLDEIYRYIEADDEEAADRFADKAWQAADSLQAMPDRGRLVPELHHPDYRELLLGNYRLVYRVYAERIEITALLHGRRDSRLAWRND